jgi:hypothetical protein
MAKDPGKPQKEFRVVIEGMPVPPEAARRINSAIQKAVLAEVAGLDLGGVSARFTGNGSTDGIRVIIQRGEIQ